MGNCSGLKPGGYWVLICGFGDEIQGNAGLNLADLGPRSEQTRA